MKKYFSLIITLLAVIVFNSCSSDNNSGIASSEIIKGTYTGTMVQTLYDTDFTSNATIKITPAGADYINITIPETVIDAVAETPGGPLPVNIIIDEYTIYGMPVISDGISQAITSGDFALYGTKNSFSASKLTDADKFTGIKEVKCTVNGDERLLPLDGRLRAYYDNGKLDYYMIYDIGMIEDVEVEFHNY